MGSSHTRENDLGLGCGKCPVGNHGDALLCLGKNMNQERHPVRLHCDELHGIGLLDARQTVTGKQGDDGKGFGGGGDVDVRRTPSRTGEDRPVIRSKKNAKRMAGTSVVSSSRALCRACISSEASVSGACRSPSSLRSNRLCTAACTSWRVFHISRENSRGRRWRRRDPMLRRVSGEPRPSRT